MVKNKLKNDKKAKKTTAVLEFPFEIVVKRLLDTPPLNKYSARKNYSKASG